LAIHFRAARSEEAAHLSDTAPDRALVRQIVHVNVSARRFADADENQIFFVLTLFRIYIKMRKNLDRAVVALCGVQSVQIPVLLWDIGSLFN